MCIRDRGKTDKVKVGGNPPKAKNRLERSSVEITPSMTVRSSVSPKPGVELVSSRTMPTSPFPHNSSSPLNQSSPAGNSSSTRVQCPKAQQVGRVGCSPKPNSPQRCLKDLKGVIRVPKMPDGTPGFYGGMGRGKRIPPSA